MQGNKKLLIIGAGQYGCVAKEIAEAMGCFERIDFVDKISNRAIATPDKLCDLRKEYSMAIVAIGDSTVRLQYISEVYRHNFQLAKLISPRAYVSPSAKIADGCILEPNATVQANAELGLGSFVSSGAVVGHNSHVECICHIDCNATVASNSTVPSKTKLDAGCIYKI